MEEHIRAYANLRLTRAREELETARLNLSHKHFRAAVSRAYYAVFYMASAALFSRSIQRSKHSAVEAAFSEFLIKPGDIEPEFGRLYQRSRRQREEADYADEPDIIDELTAQQTIEDATRFVDRIEQYMHKAGVI
jgi:uncharacterized protein (UPF0332 family)